LEISVITKATASRHLAVRGSSIGSLSTGRDPDGVEREIHHLTKRAPTFTNGHQLGDRRAVRHEAMPRVR
jgi:hypothetical protein